MPKIRLRQNVLTQTITVSEEDKERIMDNGHKVGARRGVPIVKLDSHSSEVA
jgi:hypothetical protein